MRRFSQLYLELDQTNRTGDKVAALRRYFESVPAEDGAWALHFLIGRKIKRAVSHRVMRQAALELSGYPMWLIDRSYEVVGDLGETLALIVSSPRPEVNVCEKPSCGQGNEGSRLQNYQVPYSAPWPLDPWAPPLHRLVEEVLEPMPRMDDDQRKAVLKQTWRSLDAWQRLTFHKLIGGQFRVGVARKLVARALAQVAQVDPAVMAHRLTGRWQPTARDYRRIIRGESESAQPQSDSPEPTDQDHDLLQPYPFCLAHPLEEQAGLRPSPNELTDWLGSVSDWQVQWKWDGIRSQAIKRGGDVLLWSRGEEAVTDSFPELAAACEGLADGTVLDGEIVAWCEHPSESPTPLEQAANHQVRLVNGAWIGHGQPAAFQDLQKRLGRRNVQPTLFEPRTEVVFLAFDQLEARGVDLRDQPTHVRRQHLVCTFEAWAAHEPTVGPARFRLCPLIQANSWHQLETLRQQSRELGVEGLMLKRADSPYHVGRKRGAWWKWKVDPHHIDAVLVYAQRGHGERASLFSDYTFALWDGPPPPGGTGELAPVAKAYSGLTNEQLHEMDDWIRKHTLNRRGPVHIVEPTHVIELAFEGVQQSNRHKTGLAVRFPRMARWRKDKRPEQADQLHTLQALVPG